MNELDTLLSAYDYEISPASIAEEPREPRDASRLLVYNRACDEIHEDIFEHVASYIPADALLIFNDTRVIPARLPGIISTGARVELLCTHIDGMHIRALCERFLARGERVQFTQDAYALVDGKGGSEYTLTLQGVSSVRSLMDSIGTIPLPPYLKHSRLSEADRREKYQTIFARYDGSIAAPTASLHFTNRVFDRLKEKGVEMRYITLHVNLGTFMPLTAEAIAKGELHEEKFHVPTETRSAIDNARSHNRKVLAVGTTALRAVESAYSGDIDSTTLFIREGYTFRAIDGLITNFHVPKSSLMMLVASLTGREKLLQIYSYAREHEYRFFSFGDAMLVL